MKSKNFLLKISLFVFGIFSFQSVFAQSCPDFEFTGEWGIGDTNREIKVLQELLNADRRTRIAVSGPGSPGQETEYFGNATRDALKRFQALFIEHVLVADGIFSARTKEVLNRLCKDPALFAQEEENISRNTSSEKQIKSEVKTNTQPVDTTPLTVSISSNLSSVVAGQSIKVNLKTNKPIKSIDASSVIIDGGSFTNVIKLSPTSFTFTVRPEEDFTGKLSIQIEADRLEDLNGILNESSSNELIIDVSKAVDKLTEILSTTTTPNTDAFQSILDKFFGTLNLFNPVASPTDCSKVTGVFYTDTGNPCYGKAPIVGQPPKQEDPSNKSTQQQKDQMMGELAKALGSMLGGLGKGGGDSKGGDDKGGGDKGKGGGAPEGDKLDDTKDGVKKVCDKKEKNSVKKKECRVPKNKFAAKSGKLKKEALLDSNFLNTLSLVPKVYAQVEQCLDLENETKMGIETCKYTHKNFSQGENADKWGTTKGTKIYKYKGELVEDPIDSFHYCKKTFNPEGNFTCVKN